MILEFAKWIQSTTLSHTFRDAQWLIPTSQAIHIVCVALILGSACMVSARLLGLTQTKRSVAQIADTVIPWMYGAVAVLLVTGVVQTIAEPRREFLAGLYWLKMALILCVVALTILFSAVLRRNAHAWADTTGARSPAGARVFAVVSLVLWVCIVICGRMIAYSYLLQG